MRHFGMIAAALLSAFGFYSLGGGLADRASRENAPSPALHERVRAALDEPDSIVRTAELASALRGLGKQDLEEIVAVYDERLKLDPPSRTSIELFGEAWASLDPEAAIDHMNSWPEGPRRAGISSVTRTWAGRTPIAAFMWADSLVLDDREAAVDAVFSGWADSDDPEVWDFLATLTPGLGRESASNIVMKSVVQNHSFDTLFAQVDAIESDARPGSPRDFKLSALRTAIGLCAYHDPDKALAYARRYAGGPYDNGLLPRLAVFWAVNDGPRAMDTLLALPSEPQRDKALRDGYRKWLRTEGRAALDWMPAGAAHDDRYAPLIDYYAMALAQSDLASPVDSIREALAWADRVADPKRRRAAQVLLGVLWMDHEPDAARAWIHERGIAREVEVGRARDHSRKERPKPGDLRRR